MTKTFSRRRVIGTAGGLAVAGTASGLLGSSDAIAAPLRRDPFTLGVASGDPLPDGVVLWTRLAPDPLAADGLGGMPNRVTPVQWQLAEDPGFSRVVRRGTVQTRPEWAHSVHAEVNGLQPSREYWYRFRTGSWISPVGRTKTAPAPGAAISELTFAFTSCQNFPAGYFTALGHAAEEQLDLMLHLGDYVYEGEGVSTLPGRSHLPAAEMFSLADYRLRHSQYKTDPDLQAVHASTPFLVVWDDHEVENNYADDISQLDDEPDQDPAVFRQRRAAAYRAYYENQPMRRSSVPSGPDMQIYRRISYGNLVDFSMIDTRQYRDDQIETCEGDCDTRWDPSRTILGAEQESWLVDGLAASPARWQVIGNQLITFEADSEAGSGFSVSTDNWNGYAAARQRLYDQVVQTGVQNLVIVTGDAHRNAAAELKTDFADPGSTTLGAEFLGTSVTSGGDGTDADDRARIWLAENPHIKFANVNRGYQRVRVTPETLQVDYRVIDYVTRPGAPIRTRATAVVEHGRAGIAELTD